MKTTFNTLFILLIFLGCQKEDTKIQKNSAWIQNIEYIREELPKKHVNLFKKNSKEDFNKEINILIEKAPRLTQNKILGELMRVFTRVGDSHTGFQNRENLNVFANAPVKFEVFDNGVYISEIIQSGQIYLKQKVLAINNIPIDTLSKKLLSFIPHENDYYIKGISNNILRLYEVLNALGVSSEEYTYYLKVENGENIKVSGVVPNDSTLISCYEPDKTPLYHKNNDRYYWYEVIDNNIVYLQYNTCFNMNDINFSDFVKSMFEDLKDISVAKFIIDLRLNSGGSSEVIGPLFEELKKHNNFQNRIYCCIGCKTYSSGVLAAIRFKQELNAILVGEPTGGKPNHYGDVREMSLPNTNLTVSYSTRYLSSYYDDEAISLEPDYWVKNFSYNSFSGIDSYVEFIKNNWP